MMTFSQESDNASHPSPIREGLLSSFAFPWRDLLNKTHPTESRNAWNGFSFGWMLTYPLLRTPYQANMGKGAQGARDATNINGSVSVKYTPIGAWFGSLSLYRYADQAHRAPWNPDFTYVFGYDDWHPYTFSFVYTNYGGNRLFPNPAKKEKRSNFEQGGFTLGYKFLLPGWLERAVSVETTPTNWHVGYTVIPRFTDLAKTSDQTWKHFASVGFQYPIYKYWYANAALMYYPVHAQQQPWDPDYTYGFGYFDWHPGKFSIQYNNYSGNRYPWRPRGLKTGTPAYGSISLSWSYGFQ